MRETELSKCIRLEFASVSNPRSPIELDQDALVKLGEIPRLLRAIARSFGARLGSPFLWAGVVYLEILSDTQLFDVAGEIASGLVTTAVQLEKNSQRTPPLPLKEAVDSPHCIKLLRALSSAHENSGLVASMDIRGEVMNLPQLKPSAFTEPDRDNPGSRYLRLQLDGVCKPTINANVVRLSDGSILELPVSDYPHTVYELFDLVVKNSASYSGPAASVGKLRFCALPNGRLDVQMDI